MASGVKETDELFMRECIDLSRRGAGHVSPNPLVGSVIVRNGKIIGRGYHAKFGGPHAEVNAVRNAKGNVKGATLYVNLEPCNFTGKTPPCTDLIISSGIARVVIGMEDPNPKVSGRGIRQLRRAGITVSPRILYDECVTLNCVFSKYIRTGNPYITLKIAQTIDGKIADLNGTSKWITGKASRTYTHQMRSVYDAVLVGANTIRKDNPFLTVRHTKGRNPKRVIIAPGLDIPLDANVFTDVTPDSVFVFADRSIIAGNEKRIKILSARGIKLFFLSRDSAGSFPLADVVSILGKHNIASVLVEGGAKTLGSFLEQKFVDSIACFVAPKILGKGIDTFAFSVSKKMGEEFILTNITSRMLGGDIFIEGTV